MGPALEPRAHEHGGAAQVRLVILLLGFVSLALGVAGGLACVSPSLQAPTMAVAMHGALMVSAFFGTVIALERAAALRRFWVYAAPVCAAFGGVVILLGQVGVGIGLMILSAGVYTAANAVVFARHRSVESATLLAGALAWLAGNIALFFALPAVPWWIAFFALTIGAERLELTRYLKRRPSVRLTFAVLAALVLCTPLAPRLMGIALVLLALWLFVFDLARVTVLQTKLPRYIAVCLLAGYFWLVVGGALIARGASADAALHAIFIGFVFSMVFGHAPVILPAVLARPLPYHPILYAPLALLHASLAMRVAWSTQLGAWGNAAAVALFIAIAAALVLAGSARNTERSGRP